MSERPATDLPPVISDDRQRAADAIDAAGTAEEVWTAWAGREPRSEAVLPDGPVLVVAAHPDDEVLGFGGTASRLAAAGRQVHVLTVTDGEGSHPGSRVLPPPELARVRREELAEALDVLGLNLAFRYRMGIADTRVDEGEDLVAARVEQLVRQTGAGLCVAPWSGDLHADHEAAGRAARTAAAAAAVPLWQYPVWMWHWATPGDARVPWDRLRRLPLTTELLNRKKAAVRCFRTQIAPLADHPGVVLPPDELDHHQRLFETVFVEGDTP
ncbi:PIG-L deacetylase family protein [Streptomyces sp. NPDC057235]|uniref:PIG-L deacetylase family protein n=1 Tax=Streptomyces sp. NPDC057235 TaxID=3346058 RepID=UPI0036418389